MALSFDLLDRCVAIFCSEWIEARLANRDDHGGINRLHERNRIARVDRTLVRVGESTAVMSLICATSSFTDTRRYVLVNGNWRRSNSSSDSPAPSSSKEIPQ
jgi:hypothetical protein